MQNRFPLWKNVLIVLTLLLGILYALPNLFGEDPAVQISPQRGGAWMKVWNVGSTGCCGKRSWPPSASSARKASC